MLVALFLLVALLTAPVIPTETPVIELIPSYKPLEYTEDYTIYLYPDYEHSSCPNMADVDVILGPALDMALINHREAMFRFVGEFGLKYDKLLMLKFEKTTDKEKGMPIYVKDLKPPIAGYYAHEIVIDCDVAHSSLDTQVSVILHELYHSLGLGHPFTHNDYELMSYSDIPYPSSLDIVAVWELWFGKYANSSAESINFTMVDIPYAIMEPYTAVIINNLTQENYDLRNDVKRLSIDLSTYKVAYSNLETQLEEKKRTISQLNETVNNLKAELSSANAKISSLESQVEKLESLKSSLESENELLKTRIDNLQWILLVLVVTFVCTAISLAVVWRTRKK